MTDTSKIPAERVDVNWEEVGGGAALPLFHHEWSDHLLTDTSYLRADTFSWQDGNIYFTAYNELVNEKNLTSTPAEENIAGISITYYRTPKGYKIVLATSADAVAQIYEATGIAWYYILDTDNKRFKLPREKYKYIPDTVPAIGNGMAVGLTNGTNVQGLYQSVNPSGGVYLSTNAYGSSVGTNSTATGGISTNASVGITTDPTKSGIIADLKDTVDDNVYLYFYVGNTKRGTSEIDIAAITESLNNKVDIDLSNVSSNIDYVVESYQNGTEWYKIYKSGWVEQGGIYTSSVGNNVKVTVNLLKPYLNANYNICLTLNRSGESSSGVPCLYGKPTTSSFVYMNDGDNDELGFRWKTCGQGA